MNEFWAFFKIRYKTVMQFKFAAISGIITQVFFALFRIYIILAFSVENSRSLPMEIKSTIIYIWLTQMFLSVIPWNVNSEELNMIKNGNIAYELVRPVNIFTLLFSKTLAWRVSNSFVRLIPILIINTILLPIIGLTDISLTCMMWHNIGYFLISMAIAYVLSSLITVFLYSISLLLTVATNFIGFFNSIAMLLTGTIIPLNYFPIWIRTMLQITPFKGIIDTPAMILTGGYSLEEVYVSITGQVIWCVLLLFINKLIIRSSIKRLVIQGG